MSALGHKQTFVSPKVMSAIPPEADICSALSHVRYGPKADIASGRNGCRPSVLATAAILGDPNSSLLQLVASFTREFDRQNKLEQRPILAIR
jgi:hypothetical protein